MAKNGGKKVTVRLSLDSNWCNGQTNEELREYLSSYLGTRLGWRGNVTAVIIDGKAIG